MLFDLNNLLQLFIIAKCLLLTPKLTQSWSDRYFGTLSLLEKIVSVMLLLSKYSGQCVIEIWHYVLTHRKVEQEVLKDWKRTRKRKGKLKI